LGTAPIESVLEKLFEELSTFAVGIDDRFDFTGDRLAALQDGIYEFVNGGHFRTRHSINSVHSLSEIMSKAFKMSKFSNGQKLAKGQQ
jgi:hypothetical protein